MNPLVDSRCPRCNGPLIEIDRFGERLIGCIECNRWTWPDSGSISMKTICMRLRQRSVDANRITIAPYSLGLMSADGA